MHPETPLGELVELLVGQDYRAVPVVDEAERVVGIVTNGELVRRLGEPPGVVTRLMRRVSPVSIIKDVKVTDLMVTDVVTTRPDVPIEVAIRDMLARKHKLLPVVDKEGRLIGVADRFDLLQAIARLDDQST